jgi:hypothetical protein
MNINDRELLARTLQAEAGNQGFEGMLATGSVIMNRANSSGYGNGVRGVILKPGQFSAWNSVTGYAGGEQGQDMQGMTPSADAYRAADQLIAGDYSDPTAGATHYFNPDISQPSWAKGKQFHRIGDHVFGRADGKPVDPDQAIADQTMTALGKGPRGILAAPEPEAQPMIAKQQPQGLLGSLGIQKMQPGAEGETGQRFYERDTFKDTAARLSQGFAALGGNPAVQKFASDVAAQRTEGKARNKTVEYLRKAGRPEIAEMLKNKVIKPSEAVQFLTGGGNVQSSSALPDQSGVIMTMRDGSIAVKTVGGETLQGQTALDFVNQAQKAYAEQQQEIYGARAVGKGEGERQVEEAIDVTERQRNMKSLRVVIDQLHSLSDTATYTLLGQGANELKKQLGLDPSEGAVARSEYIAVVDNQILPLLRETFGAQFTVEEGKALRATLGDPNKTPAEKKVVLDAFIAQKERDLQARTGQPAPQSAPSGGGPKRLKFNPKTGEFN